MALKPIGRVPQTGTLLALENDTFQIQEMVYLISLTQ